MAISALLILAAGGLSWALTRGGGASPAAAIRRVYWRTLGIGAAPLRLKVIDARTSQGVPGAICLIGETGDRVETGAGGIASTIEVPISPDARGMAQDRGWVTVICRKDGYHDAVRIGVPMHAGQLTETEIWFTPNGVADR